MAGWQLGRIVLVLTSAWLSTNASSQALTSKTVPTPNVVVGGGGSSYITVSFGKPVQSAKYLGSRPAGTNCSLKQVGYLTAIPQPSFGTLAYGSSTVAYPDAGPCFGYPEKLIFQSYTWTSSSASLSFDKYTLHYQSVDPQFSNGDQGLVYELIPSSESTVFSQWDDIDGLPAAASFKQTISPIGVNYAGTQVTEISPKVGVDTCWFTSSLYKPFVQVSGSSWIVTRTANQWGLDTIGVSSDIIQYYRAHASQTGAGRLPCKSTIYQQMTINYLDGDAYNHNYALVNVLTYTINSSTVTVTRAGSSVTRTIP